MESKHKHAADPPAASSVTIAAIAQYLETDPEIADEYGRKFFEAWGYDAFMAVCRFMAWAITNDMEEIIRPTLEHDLFLAPGGSAHLRTEGY
jgi:hypothetical protein